MGDFGGGGRLSELTGGNFKDGFIGAGVGALLSPMTGALNKGLGLGDAGTGTGWQFLGRTATAGVVGGTATAISGGKFGNGAVTAAFMHVVNDEMVASLGEATLKKLVIDGRNLTRPGTGADYEYFDPSENLKDWSKLQWDDDETLTLSLHGLPDSVVDYSRGKPVRYTAAKFFRSIKVLPKYNDSQVIVLFACNTGNSEINPKSTVFAQELSNLTQKPVIAPTRLLWVDDKGYTSVYGMVGGGIYLPRKGQPAPKQNQADPGRFRVFNPQN